MAAEEPLISRLAFPHQWRHYQEMVLAAFEEDRRHARKNTYIVAPPGSGKTLLGMEIVRRLGTRALVLVPNTAVQQQWLRAAAMFGAPPGVAAADPSAPVACLTYQALCQLDDPATALGDVAGRRWAQERAKATGATVAEVERDVAGWTGEAAARRKRELARITASLKREIARAAPEPVAEAPPRYQLQETGLAEAGWWVTAVDLAAAGATLQPLVLAGLLAAGACFGLAGWRLARTEAEFSGALPLDLVAHAICDAYVSLGEMRARAAASLAIEPRASGYLRCYLPAATPEESDRFTQALDQAISPADFPRYLISRLAPPQAAERKRLRRMVTGKAVYERRWVAVPDDLGRTKQRAEAYAVAWRRWLGPAELQFTQRSAAGREAAAGAGAEASDYQTSSRQIWV